jgi:hypothetical protein
MTRDELLTGGAGVLGRSRGLEVEQWTRGRRVNGDWLALAMPPAQQVAVGSWLV